MSQVHIHIPSFNAGELSPLLGARFGVEKVQSGCRRLRNFIIHPHGPAFRRPGMEYMGKSMGDGAPSRLAGFNFSTTTGHILEFHKSGLQVWDSNGPVTLQAQVPLPYSPEECAELQIAQVNDVCYLAHPKYAPRQLQRVAPDKWEISEVAWKWPPLGDENVRKADTASGATDVLLSVPTHNWPEFIVPGGVELTFEIVNISFGTKQRKALLQILMPDGTWEKKCRYTWSTSPPPTNTHPFKITPGKPRLFRIVNETPEVLATGTSVKASWGTRPEEIVSLNLGVKQPEVNAEVEVPKGDWQVTVRCADHDINKSSSIIVQKKVGNKWVDDGKPIRLRRGETTILPRTKLTVAEKRRFVWTGRAMRGGVATIDKVVYPTNDDTTIRVEDKGGEKVPMTASKPLFKASHVGSFWQLTHFRSQSKVQIVGGGRTIVGSASNALNVQGKWEVHTYGSWTTTLTLERGPTATGPWETLNSWTSRNNRNIIANGEELQPAFLRLKVEPGLANVDGTPENSPHRPRWELIAVEGKINGLVKITSVAGPFDDKGRSATAEVTVVRSVHEAGPGSETAMWTEGAWSDENGYPRTVALHGQRLWFGGTKKEAMRLWGSVVNDYVDFTRSSLADAGVSFTPAAQQQNALQWMASHGTELILGTTGDEWTVGGGAEGGPITPTSVQVQRRSAYGSSYLPSLLLGEVIVFVQRGGQKVRQVAPRATGIVWSAADMTVLAEHIAHAGVKQFATMNFPTSILWAVTYDGKLLGMTFEQEQNVFGWHVHDTDGRVESVAVVYGLESDEVWLQVERNGKRGIERLDPRVFARQFERYHSLVYLDAARRLEIAPKDPPKTVVDGLEHLEGREVQVLGDGAVLNPVRVVNGLVTLEKPVRTAIIGLPYTSELQPMRLEIPMQDGTAQHRMWRSTRVGLYLHQTIGGEISDGPGSRFEKLQFRRISTPMDSPPELFSGQMETAIESRAREAADIVIRQTEPLPLNIGSITLKGDIYGE